MAVESKDIGIEVQSLNRVPSTLKERVSLWCPVMGQDCSVSSSAPGSFSIG